MSAPDLLVLLNGKTVGTVSQASSGRLAISYDDEWRRDRMSMPVSLSMPLASRAHEHAVIDAYLRGLLPGSRRGP